MTPGRPTGVAVTCVCLALQAGAACSPESQTWLDGDLRVDVAPPAAATAIQVVVTDVHGAVQRAGVQLTPGSGTQELFVSGLAPGSALVQVLACAGKDSIAAGSADDVAVVAAGLARVSVTLTPEPEAQPCL